MLRNIFGKAVSLNNKLLFVPARTAVFNQKVQPMIEPIIGKDELNSVPADDDRHFIKVKPPLTTQSNSMFYNSRLDKFTKVMMIKSEFSVAKNIIDKAFYKIKLIQLEKRNKETDEEKRQQIEVNPLKIFLDALDNCKPLLKITSISKGGISYKCPVPMSDKEREFKATKFIIESCREKDRNMKFYDVLAYELIEASKNQGKSIKKKVDIHKLAEQNRAYAHYRWQ